MTDISMQMESWYRRAMSARERNEPLKVTPEEYQELKDLAVALEQENLSRWQPVDGACSTDPFMGGIPVVVVR